MLCFDLFAFFLLLLPNFRLFVAVWIVKCGHGGMGGWGDCLRHPASEYQQ